MTKRMLFVSMALVVFAMSLFVGVGTAFAGVDDSSRFGGQINISGLNVAYSGYESDGGSSTTLYVMSIHKIDNVDANFWTDPNDPSEGTGFFMVSGRLNEPPANNLGGMSVSMNFGGVDFFQSIRVDAFDDYVLGRVNVGSADMAVRPFDLSYGLLKYNQYTYPNDPQNPQPTTTYFNFILEWHGSFGPGDIGDNLGRPFAQVPTPGALGCFGLAGLAVLRRTGRR